jgi:hypothetical protein
MQKAEERIEEMAEYLKGERWRQDILNRVIDTPKESETPREDNYKSAQ